MNIILDLIFVLHLGWGIEGVAFASLISELAGAFLALIIVVKLYRKNDFPTISNLFSKMEWNKLFFTNVNILIRSILLEIVILSYVFFGSTFGTVTLATNHILLQFVHISSYSLDGFAFSAESLVGSAYGQKSKSKIKAVAIKSTLWAVFCAISMTLLLLTYGEKVIGLMVRDEVVQHSTQKYLFWMAITPITGVLSFMLDGIFIGATKTQLMRKAMIQSFVVYVLSIVVFLPTFGNHGLWICINIFFIARAIFLLRYYPNLTNFDDSYS